MLDAADAARRRELQRRAFAPGGALTPAEAQELRELDARGTSTPPELVAAAPSPEPADRPVISPVPGHAPDGDAADQQRSVDVNDADAAHGAGDPTPTADADGVAAAPSQPSSSEVSGRGARRRWLLPVVAGLAVLLGFGGGWLAFARGDGAPAMSEKQQEVWTRIEASGTYDPGSVQLVGDKYGVSVWEATKNGSTTDCLILTRGDDEKTGCVLPEQADSAYYYGPQTGLEYRDGDDAYMLWATFVEDVSGERRVVVQRQSTSETWDWRSQYDEAELTTAEMLVAAGFDGEFLQIIGYDGEVPVWLYESERTCLLVERAEGGIAEQCGTLMYDSEPTLELEVPGATYSVHASSTRGYDLTIVRHAEGGTTALQ